MKVQIFEPYIGGHHTQYIASLLPALLRLQEDGHVSEIVVTISQNHYQSPSFAAQLAQYEPAVRFDAATELAPFKRSSAFHVSSMLYKAITRIRPDYFISTSANYGAFPVAIMNVLGAWSGKRNLISIGIVHHRNPASRPTLSQQLQDTMHRFSRNFSPWTELHVVNPLLYAALNGSGRNAEHRIKLLPDPVSRVMATPSNDARRFLHIPEDGWYIGHVGGIDARLALPELLAAFRAANLPLNHRLLLAGSLLARYRELISIDYGDLVRESRLVILDRFLPVDELHAAYSAIDVAAVPYYDNDYLSAKALNAMAAHRPLLGSNQGYTGMLIKRFHAGWSCDILDTTQLANTMTIASKESSHYVLSTAGQRLLDFHTAENYSNAILARLHARLKLPLPPLKTWDWVLRGSEKPASD